MSTLPCRRRAFTLVEVTVAAALLAVLLTVITRTFAAVERDMRRTDERAHALRTLENLLEQATEGPWSEINDERIRQLKLPVDLLRRWPRAELTSEVVESAEPVSGKRVTLTLHAGNAVRERPLTLTTWIYHAPER